MQTKEERLDNFQFWLMDMHDALVRMKQSVPKEISDQLNYSIESLDVLEQWILSDYASVDQILATSEAQKVDGYARYVGETFRKYLGGIWMIELDDPKHVFYNLPQIKTNQLIDSPLSLVTASVDRRTGEYISGILKNFISL